MSHQSPLLSAQPKAVSVCGKILKDGQTLTVSESAIGSREESLEASGKIKIRKSNTPGKVQIVCTLSKKE